MKHQYDWNKLDIRWQFDGVGTLIDRQLDTYHSVTDFEKGEAYTEKWLDVRAQLTKCRVEPAPEPSPEYNWTKLEGTGWREGNGAFITNGKFNYWYTLGDRPRLEAFDKFHVTDALQAELSAEAAVELCRRDWLDEVTEACRGTGLSPARATRGTIATIGNALNVDDQRRMRVLSTSMLDCTKLLALSLVIERLKKLGWRES